MDSPVVVVVVRVGRGGRVGLVVEARAALGAPGARELRLEERLVQRVGLHVARVCRPQLLVAGDRGRAVGRAALRLALCKQTRSLAGCRGPPSPPRAPAAAPLARSLTFRAVVVHLGDQPVQLEALGALPGAGPRVV